MSDPRNAAHAKKVTQEKKHHNAESGQPGGPAGQPGRKAQAGGKKHGDDDPSAGPSPTAAAGSAEPSESPAHRPPAALEGSLVVLTKLKELEFHSRASLERLAELTMTVEDELKQKEMVAALGEVYSAQSLFQTRITGLIDVYKTECDRMQGDAG